MKELSDLSVDVLDGLRLSLVSLQDLKKLFVDFRLLGETVLKKKLVHYSSMRFCPGGWGETCFDLIHVADRVIELNRSTSL